MEAITKSRIRTYASVNNYGMLQKIFTDELFIFHRKCAKIYSKMMNPDIHTQVFIIITPYFMNNFTINKSREISFLPLELRISIYGSLITRSNRMITVCHLLDRMCVTLSKMDESDLLEDCVMLFTLCSYLSEGEMFYEKNEIIPHIFKNTGPITERFKVNLERFSSVQGLRNRGLQNAMLDVDNRVNREFWYGVKAFSEAEINDTLAALHCLELFRSYFESSFGFTNDFVDALETYIAKKDRKLLDNLLQEHMLDQVNLSFDKYRV